ncbi:hypothetical protein DFJ73DRAFT_867228 [Zopfochytrium polystomum]|nr:hypothetical protein DFJ73DRAFT_867228 [Zopfochytrium polystomum]
MWLWAVGCGAFLIACVSMHKFPAGGLPIPTWSAHFSLSPPCHWGQQLVSAAVYQDSPPEWLHTIQVHRVELEAQGASGT